MSAVPSWASSGRLNLDAGDTLTFYLGAGNTSSTGGTLGTGDSLVLLYRVRVD